MAIQNGQGRNDGPRRYVSRGTLRFEVFVTHRTAKMVKYHMGQDIDTVYEKNPNDFDRQYR